MTSYVNPFIGAQNSGNTYPGATLPFGMIQFSPDNGYEMGYGYSNTTMRGFSLVHLSGVGCALGGLMPMLPRTTRPTSTNYTNSGYTQAITRPLHDPANEEAHPGYYRVKTGSSTTSNDPNAVQTELTATLRTGVARYTFPSSANDGYVLINAGYALHTDANTAADGFGRGTVSSSTTIVNDTTVVAQTTSAGFCDDTWPFTVYTRTVFNRPFKVATSTTWSGATLPAVGTVLTSSTATRTGAALVFDTSSDKQVVAQTSLSYVDADGALVNLMMENVNGDFDAARAAANQRWEEQLGKIKIEADLTDAWEAEQVRAFYSAYYRSVLAPNVSDDADGRFIGFGRKDTNVTTGQRTVHRLSNPDVGLKHYYQNFSLWDTYRTQEQFVSLIAPQTAKDQAKSVVLQAEYGGWLPRWTYGPVETNIMTGDPGAVFLSAAYDQGLLDGPWGERAYRVLKESMDTVAPTVAVVNYESGVSGCANPGLENPAQEIDWRINGRQGGNYFRLYGVVPHKRNPFEGEASLETHPDRLVKNCIDEKYRGEFTHHAANAGDWDTDHGPSAHLEYALADGMFSRMAAKLGHLEVAREHAKRAQNYKAGWDPAIRFTHPASFKAPALPIEGAFHQRSVTGAFPAFSNLVQTSVFHEGTETQYEFLATHDVPGLIDLMGGVEKARERADRLFQYENLVDDPWTTAVCGWVAGYFCPSGGDSMSYYSSLNYNPNNEPDLNVPFIYYWLGQPWKTADVVNATKYLFRDHPAGMTGNDDLGTMSGWQVLTSIGVFPMAPGADIWGVVTPAFTSVEITLDTSFYTQSSGKLSISAADRSPGTHRIQSATFNGAPLTKNYLSGADLFKGAGTLDLTVGAAASAWATGPDDGPGSLVPDPGVYDTRITIQLAPMLRMAAGQTGTAYPVFLVQGEGTVSTDVIVPAGSPLVLKTPTVEFTAAPRGYLSRERAKVTVTVPTGTPNGTYTVQVNSFGRPRTAMTVVVGGPQVPITQPWYARYAKNRSIAPEKSAGADYDGEGHYIVDENLTNNNRPVGMPQSFTTAGQVHWFSLLAASATQGDTILFEGQTLDVEGVFAGVTNFSFVGFSLDNPSNTTQAVNPTYLFDDGTTQAATGMNLAPITRSGSGSPTGINRLVQLPNRGAGTSTEWPSFTSANGAVTYQGVNLYYTASVTIPKPAGKKVVALQLPTVPNARLLAIAINGYPAAPALEVPAVIVGTPVVGQVLTGPAGEWDVAGVTTTYQWTRDGVAIPGATSRTYVVAPADAEREVGLVMRGVLAGYADGEPGIEPVVVAPNAAWKAALQVVVTMYANLYEGREAAYTPESFAPLADALAMARAWIAADAVAEARFTQASSALAAAAEGLVALIDFSSLDAAIVAARTMTENKPAYVSTYMSALEAQLALALAVRANATDQAEVDAAFAALVAAITKVAEIGDLTALRALVSVARGLDPARFTVTSWGRVTAALVVADGVLAQAEPRFDEVDAAFDQLAHALEALVLRASKAGLRSAITVAQSIAASIADYVPSTVVGLPAALAAAMAVEADGDATNEDVKAAQTALLVVITQARLKAVPSSPILPAAAASAAAVDSAGFASAVRVALRTFAKASVPRVVGKAKVGGTLRARVAAWSPKAKLSYQWYRNGKVIVGATSAKYKVAAGDRGKRIKVKVTGQKSGFATKTTVSKVRAVR
ncbi:MAG: glycoside hydrolase family 92 protein [Micrococcales bacterium]|nr:glycoside hydrolase family 92 protein [Micrococcales bacterium]